MLRLFRVYVPASVAALLVSEFILIYAGYLAATFAWLRADAQVFLLDDLGWLRILIVVVCLMVSIYFHDLYSNLGERPRELLQQVGVVAGTAFLTEAMLGYLKLRQLVVPAGPMIVGSAVTIMALMGWRLFFSRVLLKKMPYERVIFLGDSPVVQEIASHLEAHPEKGLTPLGFLDDSNSPSTKRLGAISDLREVVDRLHPERIVVGLRERRSNLPVAQLLELRLSGIRIEDALSTYEMAFERISTYELRPSQLIFSSSELGPNRTGVRLQLAYTMAIAAMGVLATVPVMLLLAALVKLTSPGPMLLRQQRVGKNNRIFTLYKFRSMVQNAEVRSGAVWATRNDPRVTPVGRWLRKSRLDELPQLFNVLKGDMSIVGPRPERPEFVTELEKRIPYYRQRHCIKPGITGWAQIKHKYGDTIEDTIMKLEYDLYYIKNLAPALDAVIMFHTAKVMLLSRGAQ
ncbi:MAG: sugar transferase [Bryobacteraceae bacterium]|jgi:exopolysaccharide biosynthesis polyprenyl glycosylphosphotransferase